MFRQSIILLTFILSLFYLSPHAVEASVEENQDEAEVGVEVKLSRTTDRFIELADRTKMANDWDAHYFVSIHNNASNISKNNLNKMHDYLIKQLHVNDRGKKTANFHVLRESTMPAILLEYLFIDNKSENDKLREKRYRNYLGQITAEAIAHALDLKKR